MIGDKVNSKPKHKRAARAIFEMVRDELRPRTAFTVAGQSGAGKSEIAWELAQLLEEAGHRAYIFQQDDYFVYPPRTNHKRRLDDIQWVGTQEVRLDLLDEHLAAFKSDGPRVIEKPLVIFDEDRIVTEQVDLSPFDVVIAEGTYTTLLKNADYRVFIDRDYHDTLADRKERGRDPIDEFSEQVLKIEDGIISRHRDLADFIVRRDFTVERVDRERQGGTE